MATKIRILSDSVSAEAKPPKPIVVTENEANSYLKYHGSEILPRGVRDAAIRIGDTDGPVVRVIARRR